MNRKKIIKSLASIKLAVIVISSIAIITAIGTIVESKYDAQAAKKLVYESVYMYIIMGVFAVNLISVMVDRWPWKKHHAPFILAHIGILVLMAGQFITSEFGIDGSMRVGIGEDNRFVTLPKTDVIVYSSFDGNNYSKIYEKEVDFFRHPPSKEKPFEVYKNQIDLKFSDHHRYAIPQREVVPGENSKLGPGVRIQLNNGMANFIEWLVQRNPTITASQDLGPLKVNLGPIPKVGKGINEIYLQSVDEKKIKYAFFGKESLDPRKTGVISEGDAVPTGWMNLELRVLRYFPKAEETWKIQKKDYPTPLTTEALLVEFQGKQHWMLLNDTVKFFTDQSVYFVTYANRRMDIGFPIYLENFNVSRYQGTNRAMAYQSQVTVPEIGSHEISMNEPLKHQGLTIYQASFQDGPMGKPIASIFSINKDPGRWIKYLGSLIMSIGIILLFYFKKFGKNHEKK